MFRSIIRGKIYQIIPKRNFRMFSKLRSEEVMEDMKKSNPYFDKYAAKLAAVQQKSPEEFLSKLENVKKDKTKPKFGPPKLAPKHSQAAVSTAERDYSELMHPKESIKEAKIDPSGHKKLSDIMKLDLVQNKTAEELKLIWIEYHKNKEVIVATIPIEHFDRMNERAKKFPLFIYPIPRSEGYEFILMQFFANTVHFTPLLCYQVHKENAPECLNMAYYSELRDKGLILMRGEYDPKVLTAQEAQCLANQLQLYYSQNNESKLKLLEVFSRTPEKFKHEDVIKELENLTL